ncbi:unnamed protein product [marine sediment metagenome]|uniref:Uncharacterized protein n=1 Tax=marine sediment metagenome TaxID=412755 RepID=X1B7Z5_9ZZZZ
MVTNTFTNGTTADATEVNTNFTESDGTLCFGGTLQTVAEATRYVPITGVNTTSYTTSKSGEILIPRAGTVQNLYVQANANSHDQSMVLTIFVNGIATSVIATVTAGSTAVFSDVSNTAAITAGQSVSLRVVLASGTGSVSDISYGVEIVS